MLLTDKEYPGSIKHSLYDKDFGYINIKRATKRWV